MICHLNSNATKELAILFTFLNGVYMIDQLTNRISKAMYSAFGLRPDKDALRAAVAKDLKFNGNRDLSANDIENLVEATNDEDEEHAVLIKMFPNTFKELNSCF